MGVEIMKIVEIMGNVVHHVYDEYETLAEARQHYAPNIRLEEAPDDVFESWIFDETKQGDERYSRPPIPEGWVWDEQGLFPYDPIQMRSDERRRLHSETSDDTLEALRKMREGDQTIDWSAWLDQLDAYNLAIEATKEQEGYPLKVTYPEYPLTPTKNENGGGGS